MNLNANTGATVNLLIHYHVECSFVDGIVAFPSFYGRWIDSLAQYFAKIYVVAYVKEGAVFEHSIKSINVELISLGPKPSFLGRIKNLRRYQLILKKYLDQVDIFFYRVPTLLCIYFYILTAHKTNVLLLVGHLVNSISKKHFFEPKMILWRIYWCIDHLFLSLISKKCLVLANGPSFHDEFPFIKRQDVVFTSTIWHRDVVKAPRVRCSDVAKILFIGRIAPEKSLETLLEALAFLKGCCPVELVIIGEGDDLYVEKLKTLMRRLGLSNVTFGGYVTNADGIFHFIDEADIFVVPSEKDWQPRAVWEAMARGVPVICSKGVSSPYLLFKDQNLIQFFDVHAADQLASLIQSLVLDQARCYQISEKGLNVAKSRTLEKSAEAVATKIIQFHNRDGYDR